MGAEHFPQHRIERAVAAIRRARGIGHADDGYPHDLGCETQLYLGIAIEEEFPGESITTIALACGVTVPDAIFFAELREIARGGTWLKPAVLDAAQAAIGGGPIDWSIIRPTVRKGEPCHP